MSTLKADTIVASDGTSPVTLTKQSAAKATLRGNSSATLTNSFNISSGTDVATGRFTYSLVNSFSSIAYVQSGTVEGSAHGTILTRDTTLDEVGTIAVEIATSTSTLVDSVHNAVAHGDLA